MDVGQWMTFRPDDGIAVETLHYGDEALDVPWIELHICIDEGDKLAARVSDAATQRVAFPHVPVVLDDLDVRRDHALSLAHRFVSIAIRNDDHLVRPAKRLELAQ